MTNKEIETLIERYHITTTDGMIKIPGRYAEAAKRNNMLETIKANKPLIISAILDKQEAERRAYEEREEKIKAIEGLEEIENCREAWRRWHAALNRMMDTGSSKMSVARPGADEKELRAKYPRANAYLIAYAYSVKSNFEISAIGSKALERIINGEDYTKVIADMDADLKGNTLEHIWD